MYIYDNKGTIKGVNNEFQESHSRFMLFDMQLKGIDSKYDVLKSSIVSKYRSKKQKQIAKDIV